MSNIQLNKVAFGVDDLVRGRTEMPEFVFIEKFGSYVFFDLDIVTSVELAVEIQNLIEGLFDSNELIHVFSAGSREQIASLSMGYDWPNNLLQAGQSLRNEGDCGGLILVPTSGQWLAFQNRPVDIGVIALKFAGNLDMRKLEEGDCFFDCRDVAEWMRGDTERDVNLRENYGEWFLRSLIENYCMD